MNVRSVQDAMATRDCEWPGCPSDAEHGDGLCERHHRLQSNGSTLPPPARCDECNALLTRAHSEACSRYVDLTRRREPETNGDSPMTAHPCRMPDCPNPAAEETIGARRQGGRYDLCEAHLEALAQRARDTRKANREARERENELHAAELRALGQVGRDLVVPPMPEEPTLEESGPGELEDSVTLEWKTLGERLADAYVQALEGLFAAIALEARTGTSTHALTSIIPRAIEVLNLAPQIRDVADLLAQRPVDEVPSAE